MQLTDTWMEQKYISHVHFKLSIDERCYSCLYENQFDYNVIKISVCFSIKHFLLFSSLFFFFLRLNQHLNEKPFRTQCDQFRSMFIQKILEIKMCAIGVRATNKFKRALKMSLSVYHSYFIKLSVVLTDQHQHGPLSLVCDDIIGT